MNPSSPEPSAPQASSDDWDPDREPVEELAGEFVDRRRRGERVTVDEYAARYPQLADEIRELFPAVIAMEKLNRRVHADLKPPHQNISVEQLGDFRVINEIARGGMGIVYEAEQVTLGRRVAVKVLPKMALRNEKDILRFQRKAQTSAKLHHTNIVPVFGVGEQDGMHYIVMQFIQGVGLDEIRTELRRLVLGSAGASDSPSTDSARSSYVKRNAASLLSERMRRNSDSDSGSDATPPVNAIRERTARKATTPTTPAGRDPQPVPSGRTDGSDTLLLKIDAEYWRNVVRIGLQAANALQYAHAHGTLHRDVKPGNLLLDGEGVVWVADFGLAKAVEQDDVTWTGDIVGTLGYMAPERFHGDCDQRSDLYGLGLTLYELLTFERAFEGSDRVALMHRVATGDLAQPRRRNPAIPLDLETIVMKAAARRPGDRYQSAADLAADLQNFLEDRPIHARRARPVELLVRWCRRNRTVAGLAATVAALLVLVSFVMTWGYVRESRQRQRAEATSQLAVEALERIYGQYAPSHLPIPAQTPGAGDVDAESLLDVQTQMPLSPNVAQLLDNLLEFYDQLSRQTEDDQNVLLKSIMANRRVADIQFRLGQNDTAKATYERAIGRAQKVNPVTQPMTLELARIHNGLGAVLLAQRDRDGAVESHQQAMKLLDPYKQSLDARYEHARTVYLMHQARRRPSWARRPSPGEPDRITREKEVQQIAQQAASLASRLAAEHSDVPEYRFLLAKCFRASQTQDGEPQVKAIKLLKELVEQHPDVADYRYELGSAFFDGVYRRIRGGEPLSPKEIDAAEHKVQSALAVTSDIELTHPNIPQYLDLKTRLHYSLAKIQQQKGQHESASQNFAEATQRQAWAVRCQPDEYRPRIWVSWLKLEWSRMLIDANQPQVACEQLKAIPGIMEGVRTAEIDSRHMKRVSERIRVQTDELLKELSSRRN